MVVNNRVTKHQIEFPQNHLSIKDIFDELKKFRLRLYGKGKFQEPEIRMSKFGVVKSPKDETLISLKEELIEYKLKSPKARKSPKEIKKIIEKNNIIADLHNFGFALKGSSFFLAARSLLGFWGGSSIKPPKL